MLVVADSSPLNILIRIACIDVLPQLFGQVLIPPEVRGELSDPRAPEVVRAFIASPPAWLQIREAAVVEHIPPLDRGEEAAISLAREVGADALLIDERDGRRAARLLGLAIVGTIGVLEEAAGRGLVSFPSVIERLKSTNFRVDPRMIEAALRRAGGRADKGGV